MSDMELHIGKIKKSEKTIDTVVDEYLKENELPSYIEYPLSDEDKREIVRDYLDYVILDNELYENQDTKYDDDDIFQMSQNPDGSFSYVLRYYNGGCGFEEAIETAFKGQK